MEVVNMKDENGKQISPYSREYWIRQGFTDEEADYERNSRRPIRKEYWMKKGFSEEESIKRSQECKSSNNRKGAKGSAGRSPEEHRKSSKRCKEYWLDKGFSEEDAIKIVSERQSTFSLDKCVEKYGEEEGRRRWQDRQDKWQETLSKRDDMNDINKRKSPLSYDKLRLRFNSNNDLIEFVLSFRPEMILNDNLEDFDNRVYQFIQEYPDTRYLPVKSFCHTSKVCKLQLDILGIDESYIEEKFLSKEFDKSEIKIICGCYAMYIKNALLRSSYEIYFYELLQKYGITNFTVDKQYPNSSFKYDFFLKDFNIFVEICPKYHRDEKYKVKMDKKKELFGCILLKESKDFEPFIKELLSEDNCRDNL